MPTQSGLADLRSTVMVDRAAIAAGTIATAVIHLVNNYHCWSLLPLLHSVQGGLVVATPAFNARWTCLLPPPWWAFTSGPVNLIVRPFAFGCVPPTRRAWCHPLWMGFRFRVPVNALSCCRLPGGLDAIRSEWALVVLKEVGAGSHSHIPNGLWLF